MTDTDCNTGGNAAVATVTIEKFAGSTRYRGTRQSLLEFELANERMFPAPGERAEGQQGAQSWSLEAVPDSDAFHLDLSGARHRPVAIAAARRRPPAGTTSAQITALRTDLLQVVERYNELGMNTLTLLDALLRRTENGRCDAADLTITVERLRQIYAGLAQRNRAAMLGVPRR